MIFKDADEAEWEAFQKEIAVEVAASADLAATDQLEETVDRQLEEIDDQMRAWSRVRNIEIRKDDVDTKLRDKKTGVQNDIKTVVKTENSDDEVKSNLSHNTGCPTKNVTLFWRAVAPLNLELEILDFKVDYPPKKV